MQPKIGLVLGGGGLAGAAFHSGVLTALETDLGFDARRCEVIVGTSAGALIGLLLRMGATGSDVAALVSGFPGHAEHYSVRMREVVVPDVPELRRWRSIRPASPSRPAFKTLLRRPARWLDPASVMLLLRAGELDVRSGLGFIDRSLGDVWPDGDLRICAIDAKTLDLVVWDKGHGVSVADAVASSCALPGLAQDVMIDGGMYLDGGLRSPTNADVLCDSEVDVVVILSALTPLLPSSFGLVWRWAEHRLRDEVKRLEGMGKEVVVLKAPASVVAAAASMSQNGLDLARLVGESYLMAGEAAANALSHLSLTR